jgi:hypothetical protein
MTKVSKASSEKDVVKGSPFASKRASAEAGQSATVKGVGALQGYDLKIKRGVSLLKPIAKQGLSRRSEKRKAR